MWVRICIFRLSAREHRWFQYSHLNGFSFVCVSICLRRWAGDPNFLLHYQQLVVSKFLYFLVFSVFSTDVSMSKSKLTSDPKRAFIIANLYSGDKAGNYRNEFFQCCNSIRERFFIISLSRNSSIYYSGYTFWSSIFLYE